jgi:hypothetical protein
MTFSMRGRYEPLPNSIRAARSSDRSGSEHDRRSQSNNPFVTYGSEQVVQTEEGCPWVPRFQLPVFFVEK